MPFVRIQLKEGRTPNEKADMAKAIVDLMVEKEFADKAAIRVIFEEMSDENYFNGMKL